MNKQKNNVGYAPGAEWIRKPRIRIPSSFEICDQKIEVEYGQAQSVEQLFKDFVLGRLDPSQIGGQPVFDKPGSQDVDPFNTFGMTLEQADALRQASEHEIRRARKEGDSKTVANAQPATKQEDPKPAEDPNANE